MQFPKINLNNWLKATFNDSSDIKKQYVNASYHVVQYTVNALNVLMKHLIDVQDLDTSDPVIQKHNALTKELQSILGAEYQSGDNSKYKTDWSTKQARKTSILLDNSNSEYPDNNADESDEYDYKWAETWSEKQKKEHHGNARFGELLKRAKDEQKAIIAKDGYCNDGYSDGYSSLKISSDGSFNLKSDVDINLESDMDITNLTKETSIIDGPVIQNLMYLLRHLDKVLKEPRSKSTIKDGSDSSDNEDKMNKDK